jgi:D-3-phosphoglycerate dehydrogenase
MGPLRGETVGLLGYGRLARAVAERLRPFGVRLLTHDPYLAGDPGDGTGVVGLAELLERSDYLSVHVPMSAETAGLVGARELALMKPGAYVVNTARGGVIDEQALGEALASGRLAGAGLDVWEVEPPPRDHPVLAHDNVIATHHTAFFSDHSLVELRRRVAATVVDFVGGRPLTNVVAGPGRLDETHDQDQEVDQAGLRDR